MQRTILRNGMNLRFPAALVCCFLAIAGTAAAFGQTTLSGRTIDINSGAPLPGALVDLRTPQGLDPYPYVSAYTDSAGHFMLHAVPPGRWRVRMTYGIHGGLERLLTTPTLNVGKQPRTFTFEVNLNRDVLRMNMLPVRVTRTGQASGAMYVTVNGRVAEFRDNGPISNVQVRLLSAARDSTTNADRETIAISMTGKDGRFTLPLVPAGRYFLDVMRHGYETRGPAPIRVDAPLEVIIRMWAAETPPQAPGRILDEHGRPLENITVLSQTPWLGSLYGQLFSGDRPAVGAAVVLLDPSGNAVPGVIPGKADQTGVFRVDAVDPGTYWLRILYQDKVVDVPDVVVEAGVLELNIRF